MLRWGVNLSQKWLQHLLLKGNRHVKGSSQNLDSMILLSSLLYHTQAIVLLCELQGSFAELWKSFAEMKSNYFSNEWLSATSENMELMRAEKSLDATKRYDCAQASLAQAHNLLVWQTKRQELLLKLQKIHQQQADLLTYLAIRDSWSNITSSPYL